MPVRNVEALTEGKTPTADDAATLRAELEAMKAQLAARDREVKALKAEFDEAIEPSTRTTRIGDTEVEIDPQTGRPRPGSILTDADGRHGHKIPWTRSDIERKYASVTWYNYTGHNQVTVNGVRWSFGSGEVTTPSIIKDIAIQAYNQQASKDNFVRDTGGSVAVGRLEPRPQ